MRNMTTLLAAGILSGCSASPTIDGVSSQYVDSRRELHTDLTATAEAWQCRGMSVYEWQRAYGTPERAAAWRVLCGTAQVMPIP